MAGLATAPHFMERFRLALQDNLAKAEHVRQLGRPVHSELLFPYGDWRRRVFPQLWEIRADMRLGLGRISNSIGGNRVMAAIRSRRSCADNHRIVRILVGHSGGGIAAVHAAELLMEQEGNPTCLVVMIGSPRCRIPERLRSSVLSISAAGRRKGEFRIGKSPDIVSRLGSYGGWRLGSGTGAESETRNRLPYWQRNKHAPASLLTVPIIGGHADYFREHKPYVNAMGESNLDVTLAAIQSWLIQWYRATSR